MSERKQGDPEGLAEALSGMSETANAKTLLDKLRWDAVRSSADRSLSPIVVNRGDVPQTAQTCVTEVHQIMASLVQTQCIH